MNNNLIITTGDTSDADGFMSLAKYATSSNDVIFIMNYPAICNNNNDIIEEYYNKINDLNIDIELKNFCKDNFLGFNYNIDTYLQDKFDLNYYYNKYFNNSEEILENYKKFYNLLTYLAIIICKKIWKESGSNNKLFFAKGGINDINPFKETNLKNDILTYKEIIENNNLQQQEEENIINYILSDSIIYNINDNSNIIDNNNLFIEKDIYIDMNGSAAFYNDNWNSYLSLGNIKGFHIMGSVLDDEIPKTLGPFDTLHRLPQSTMNQFYSPMKSKKLLDFIKTKNVPIFVISNNIIDPFFTKDDDNDTKKNKLELFLIKQNINTDILKLICEIYYIKENGASKFFDYISTLSLLNQINKEDYNDNTKNNIKTKKYALYFNDIFGTTILKSENIYDIYNYDLNCYNINTLNNNYIIDCKNNFKRLIINKFLTFDTYLCKKIVIDISLYYKHINTLNYIDMNFDNIYCEK